MQQSMLMVLYDACEQCMTYSCAPGHGSVKACILADWRRACVCFYVLLVVFTFRKAIYRMGKGGYE